MSVRVVGVRGDRMGHVGFISAVKVGQPRPVQYAELFPKIFHSRLLVSSTGRLRCVELH